MAKDTPVADYIATGDNPFVVQPVATPASSEQTVTLNMEQLAVLLKNTVDAAIGPLMARVDRLDAGQSRIVRKPPEPTRRRQEVYQTPEHLRQQAMKNLAKDGHAAGTSLWLDTPRARQAIPQEYWPVFRPGDLVRINPDVVQRGDTRLWSEILPKHTTNPEGIGEILGTTSQGDDWQPKYKVAMAGFSGGSCGLWESELLPYEPDDY